MLMGRALPIKTPCHARIVPYRAAPAYRNGRGTGFSENFQVLELQWNPWMDLLICFTHLWQPKLLHIETTHEGSIPNHVHTVSMRSTLTSSQDPVGSATTKHIQTCMEWKWSDRSMINPQVQLPRTRITDTNKKSKQDRWGIYTKIRWSCQS